MSDDGSEREAFRAQLARYIEASVPPLYVDSLRAEDDAAARAAREREAFVAQVDAFVAQVMEAYRCADGSLVHDFKGESRCPACGFEGIRLDERVQP